MTELSRTVMDYVMSLGACAAGIVAVKILEGRPPSAALRYILPSAPRDNCDGFHQANHQRLCGKRIGGSRSIDNGTFGRTLQNGRPATGGSVTPEERPRQGQVPGEIALQIDLRGNFLSPEAFFTPFFLNTRMEKKPIEINL